MTQDDAKRIKQAAIVMLHAIDTDVGDGSLTAALKWLPVAPEHLEHVSLRTARELLQATLAWTDADKVTDGRDELEE